jgi:hypothetical protein
MIYQKRWMSKMQSIEWFFRKTYLLAKLLNIFQMDTILVCFFLQ